ncbi:O-antigen ligase family protein [Skermanella pratensis]|uniref:O-antigen ligase family protein n=1 Tax=Skermanella pratensis TaxID=2233999 RepID=UPI0013016F3C|nr:O-antigen ligase family protein [Skermanella pratensis]
MSISRLSAARALTYSIPLLFLVGRMPADLAVIVTGILFLIDRALARDWSWVSTPWLMFGLMLWTWLMAMTPLSIDPMNSLDRTLGWGRYLLFAAALQHWVLTMRHARVKLLWSTASAMSIVILVAFYEFLPRFAGHEIVDEMRLMGPFSDPVVGTYLQKLACPVIGGMLGWAFTRGDARSFGLVGGAVAILGVAIFLSGERMPTLLFVFGLVLFGFFLPEVRRLLWIVSLGLVILVLGVALFNETMMTWMFNRSFAQIMNLGNSDYGQIWRTSLAIWLDHPLSGVGLRNYRVACADAAYDLYGPNHCQLHPHNIYLEWLVEGGIIGLTGFLILLGLVFRPAAKTSFAALSTFDRCLAIGALAGVITFVWPLASSQSAFSNWNGVLLWLAIGWLVAVTDPRSASTDPVGRPSLQC